MAALAAVSSWSLGGLFLSLGPDLAGHVLHSDSVLVSGLVVFALPIAGAGSQIAFGRGALWASASGGSLVLSVGTGLLVLAVAVTSPMLLVIACVIAGAGFGVTFLGGLRALSVALPAEHRAAVMSAFYVVAYASISLPAIAAGFCVSPLGLTETFEIFGGAIALIALVVAREAWRQRPTGVALATDEVASCPREAELVA